MNSDSLLAAVGGCSAAAVLARYTISKALGDLEKLTIKVQELSESLASFSVRLEKLREHDKVLKEHEEKIIKIFEGKHERSGSPRVSRTV